MDSPWDIAYKLYKEYYTKEEIDEMLFCEISELLRNEENE